MNMFIHGTLAYLRTSATAKDSQSIISLANFNCKFAETPAETKTQTLEPGERSPARTQKSPLTRCMQGLLYVVRSSVTVPERQQ